LANRSASTSAFFTLATLASVAAFSAGKIFGPVASTATTPLFFFANGSGVYVDGYVHISAL